MDRLEGLAFAICTSYPFIKCIEEKGKGTIPLRRKVIFLELGDGGDEIFVSHLIEHANDLSSGDQIWVDHGIVIGKT